MDFKVLQDKVAVRPITEEQSQSGLIVIDTTESHTMRGEVVAVGPGDYLKIYDDEGKVAEVDTNTFIEMQVEVGDIVVYPKNSGSTMIVDGDELYVLNEFNVLAVIKE